MKTSKIQFANGAQAGGSFYNNSITKKVAKSNGKSLDKKKVLPTKKFPELKLMINGEYRNNQSLSSDDEMSLAVRSYCYDLVSTNQKDKRAQGHSPLASAPPATNAKHVSLQCRRQLKHGWYH